MRITINLCLYIVAAAFVWSGLAVLDAQGQGTAFTYQGQLMNNGQPANGSYDLTFTLFANSQYGFPVGSVVTNLDTSVSTGLFTASLDFGSVFSGSNYWLEIAVRTNGNGTFTTLAPRQPVTPVPYAVFSANASNAMTAQSATSAAFVPAAGITGTISTGNLGSNVALLTANGTLPTNVLPANVGSGSGIVWQVPSATVVQALPNTGYVLTNSQQVTVTLPAAPTIGDRVEITAGGLGGWLLAQNAGQTIAASFAPLSLAGDASGIWESIASSSDGTKLAAASQGENNGGIWTSGNAGASWLQASAPGGYWYCIGTSADGTRLAAVASGIQIGDGGYPGGIWTSSNGGTNWAEVSPMLSGFEGGNPLALASSSDGTRLALTIGYDGGGVGGIWISTNSGTNWFKTSAPTNLDWSSVASSSDGTKLAAANNGRGLGGSIWISSNAGTSWVQTSESPLADWQSIASSSNGTVLVAAAPYVYIGTNQYPGGIWISTNEGATWVQTSAPNFYWTGVASSSDGTKFTAVASGYGVPGGGGIWISTNSGTDWTQIGAPALDWVSTLSTSGWNCVASSSDGTEIATGSGGNGVGIWTIANGVVSHQSAAVTGSTMVGTAGFLEGNFGSVVELVYAGEGQFIALYQTGSVSGH